MVGVLTKSCFIIICISQASLCSFRWLNLHSNRHCADENRCQQFQTIAQHVDHFGFLNTDTFTQRYILNTDYWQHDQPIFFYTGNEGLVLASDQKIHLILMIHYF